MVKAGKLRNPCALRPECWVTASVLRRCAHISTEVRGDILSHGYDIAFANNLFGEVIDHFSVAGRRVTGVAVDGLFVWHPVGPESPNPVSRLKLTHEPLPSTVQMPEGLIRNRTEWVVNALGAFNFGDIRLVD